MYPEIRNIYLNSFGKMLVCWITHTPTHIHTHTHTYTYTHIYTHIHTHTHTYTHTHIYTHTYTHTHIHTHTHTYTHIHTHTHTHLNRLQCCSKVMQMRFDIICEYFVMLGSGRILLMVVWVQRYMINVYNKDIVSIAADISFAVISHWFCCSSSYGELYPPFQPDLIWNIFSGLLIKNMF